MKDIEIHNYSKMKKDLKRFSFDVDVNMHFNGWERVTTMDVSRADKSVDLVRGIHIARKYMIKLGDSVEAKTDAQSPLLANIKRQLQGRVGIVIAAWEPVNGNPSFWMQCTVKFPAVGRKKEVTFDLMQDWLTKVKPKAI